MKGGQFSLLALFLALLLIAGIVEACGKRSEPSESTPLLESAPQSAAHEAPLKEARFYRQLEDGWVQCQICPRMCTMPEGGRGFCRNRENRRGKLYSLVYGRPCTVNMTVPEKGPMYHFIPGHRRLALATVSCNLRCKYCQNWHISQVSVEEVESYDLSPQEVVELALREGAESVSFTYTEPIAFYEYVYDISKLAKAKGLKTSIVSNGFINPQPLREWLTVLDVVKIDLKGFSDELYREVSSAELGPVLNSLKIVKEEGIHLEIVNLVVPTLNDDPQEIREMCEWIAENLGAETPLHFTRFFPNYNLTHLPPTPIKTLERAKRVAEEEGLKYVYLGNLPGHEANNTYCPKCGKLLIKRMGFHVLENNVVDGRCKFCGEKIPGIWE